ncbi:MAG: tRNA dihydrouridine synthase DusB [Candidatus Riflebacteria bacterium]|nr:tRNA dihydrouridine synthase DusB [Candidatus Riflebacteria bacterium]
MSGSNSVPLIWPVMPLDIGTVRLKNNLLLAPMAGVTDGPFRRMCHEQGAGLTISELASAKAILLGNKTTVSMLHFSGQQRPFAVQLFGHNSADIAAAASFVESLGVCDIIDLNMGCPVSKVVKTGAGAGLMKTPELAETIIRAVRAAVKVPVTVKFRLGWCSGQMNFRDFARMAVDSGVAAITVHARTREAGYSGVADWSKFEGMQDLCGSIPFIANGDITSVDDLKKVHEISGCRGFMIGRAAIGRPWLFNALKKPAGAVLTEPAPAERFRLFREHLVEMLMEHGQKGVPLFRVHLFAYLRGHPRASQFRREMCNQRDPVKVIDAGQRFFLP